MLLDDGAPSSLPELVASELQSAGFAVCDDEQATGSWTLSLRPAEAEVAGRGRARVIERSGSAPTFALRLTEELRVLMLAASFNEQPNSVQLVEVVEGEPPEPELPESEAIESEAAESETAGGEVSESEAAGGESVDRREPPIEEPPSERSRGPGPEKRFWIEAAFVSLLEPNAPALSLGVAIDALFRPSPNFGIGLGYAQTFGDLIASNPSQRVARAGVRLAYLGELGPIAIFVGGELAYLRRVISAVEGSGEPPDRQNRFVFGPGAGIAYRFGSVPLSVHGRAGLLFAPSLESSFRSGTLIEVRLGLSVSL